MKQRVDGQMGEIRSGAALACVTFARRHAKEILSSLVVVCAALLCVFVGISDAGRTEMKIPMYYQTDYNDVAYGSGSIATVGCGPTCLAMVASYLTGTEILPEEAISWCGDTYYHKGIGTEWTYFNDAAEYFGLGEVVWTESVDEVLEALEAGMPVISSQSEGLFTDGGHFIVLRGVTKDGKILVNDPNDDDTKNYYKREFDMETEIDATSKRYFIFCGS